MTNAQIKKWDFTIERKGVLERTVVGRDGQVHHPRPNGHGRDQHFTAEQENEYLQSINAALVANRGTPGEFNRQDNRLDRVIRVGPLEFDSFGLLPADGYGRLSSEDY